MKSLATLQELLIDEMRDLYSAETQLVKALPKLSEAASAEPLRQAFKNHLVETEGHVARLEQAFEVLGVAARPKTCKAMEGLIAEGEDTINLHTDPAIRDAALIGAAQRVEHYEIAGYGTARAFAQTLGLDEVTRLFTSTIEEEGLTDKKLTALAASINEEALSATPVRFPEV